MTKKQDNRVRKLIFSHSVIGEINMKLGMQPFIIYATKLTYCVLGRALLSSLIAKTVTCENGSIT